LHKSNELERTKVELYLQSLLPLEKAEHWKSSKTRRKPENKEQLLLLLLPFPFNWNIPRTKHKYWKNTWWVVVVAVVLKDEDNEAITTTVFSNEWVSVVSSQWFSKQVQNPIHQKSCVRPKKIKQAFDNIKGSSIACLS